MFATLLLLAGLAREGEPAHLQGALAGEPTATSVVLQTRLTAGRRGAEGDVPGCPGVAVFELSRDPSFPAEGLFRSGPLVATPERDFVVRARFEGLDPDAAYSWRVRSGPDPERLAPGPAGRFRTLPGPERSAVLRFCVVTGMNHHRFHSGYAGEDRALGYPALDAIGARAPHFVVFTGDNVYYDTPREGRARALPELRRKWHEQLAQPRFHELFARAATFWMKDDHDHRFNDCDTTGERLPTSALGIEVFREQVPISDVPGARTWRTHRASRELQVWLVEGRDHRSPNAMPDGPEKTLWGAEQLAWLKRTLLASDAEHLLLVSPTPVVGPDDAYKADNHTSPKGFRREGEAFLSWVVEEGLLPRFAILCGDRHWQYHSIHPSGVEEFSCGALVDANARMGRAPGDPKSTDPEAAIRQPYASREPGGGFLEVVITPGEEGSRMELLFRDERGRELHRTTRGG